MSTLVFVRHGQASFLQDDYDKLSPLGEEQARLLGAYWGRRGERFDAVVAGPRVRQVGTARIAAEAAAAAGAPWPAVEVRDALDEMHIEAVIRHNLPALATSEPGVGQLIASLGTEGTAGGAFRALYELIVGRWVRGELAAPGAEPWTGFVARVEAALAALRAEHARKRRVLVFTSAGPVAVAMRAALGLTDGAAMDLAAVVRNAAVSEFLYSGERFTLSGFNAAPHLERAELHTYR